MKVRYALRRSLQILPLILGVVVVNFLLVHLSPGDPASALAGDQAPREYVEQLRREYGLDQPLLTQLVIYLQHLVQLDLGYSFSFQRPVIAVIAERIPATVLLIAASEIPAIIIGTLLGAYSARHYGSWIDRVTSFATLGLYSVPVFWSGMLLILVFAQTLGWLPTSGMRSYTTDDGGLAGLLDLLRHLLLPALALGLYLLPTYVRLARASVLEVMREDYITTARAVGYRENRIFFRYALRNALLPTVTAAGISLGLTFSGALLAETVFAWPGMGQLMFNAVFQRDYPVLMGVFLVTALCVAVASLIADFVYAMVDPRVLYD